MANVNGWHGKFGHINCKRLDHDSANTGYGKHDRVVACCPYYEPTLKSNAVYCRVDLCWELGMPTERQLIAVARKHSDIKGRWKLASTPQFGNGKSIDCYLIPANQSTHKP